MTEVGDVVSLIQGTSTGGELEQSPQPLVWYNAHSSHGTIEVTNVEIALLFLPTLPSPRRLDQELTSLNHQFFPNTPRPLC